VNLISSTDTTAVGSVKRRVQNKKVDIQAPEVVINYNKYMGGVDKHDKLQSTFALGKQHKFKKYYIKLLPFLMDIALTNSWIYFKMANSEEAKGNESCADFFVQIATEMVRQDVDGAAKYKIRRNVNVRRSSRRTCVTDNNSESGILPCGRVAGADVNAFVNLLDSNVCTPISFKTFPFPVARKSRRCKLCNYEMCHDKWKGVVLCSQHGVRLCTESHPP
jgi:hypothetical protein